MSDQQAEVTEIMLEAFNNWVFNSPEGEEWLKTRNISFRFDAKGCKVTLREPKVPVAALVPAVGP